MAYQLGQQIEMLSKYSNVDLLYGPYNTIKDACENIPESTRDYGRTVLIFENGEYKEYWWKDGIKNDDLVLKLSATTGNVQLVQGKNTTGIVKNGSDVEEAKGYTPSPIIEGIPYFKDIIRLNETNVINNLADDDLGININIKPNIEFIWIGQFQYWDDGVPHTLVPNTVYIKYFNDITQNYAYEVKQYLGNPILPTLDKIDLIPDHLRFIGMTVIVNDTKEEYWFKDGIEDNNLIKKIITPNNGTLTLKVGDNEQTFSANQKRDTEFEIKASDLGLSAALTYCGITTSPLTDGSTTNPIIINGDFHTAHAGCVVFYGDKEYVWNGSNWEELGYPTTVDLSGYKTIQAPVTDNDAREDKSSNADRIRFVSNVTQDTNGEIQVHKKNINTAKKDTLGLVKTSSNVTNTAGYTPCPIVNGVPYYETINLEESNKYITIIDDRIIESLYYLKADGNNIITNHINFPSNRIIFYKGSEIYDFCSENGTILGTLLPGNFYITKSSDYTGYDYNDNPTTLVWGECINLEYQTDGYNKLFIDYSKPITIDYTKDIIEIHDNSNEDTVKLSFDYPNNKMLKGKHIKIFYFNDHSSTNKKLDIKSTDNKCYIVGDSTITYNIAYGNRCIMIDVYILDENLIINVTENINKKQ